MDKTASRVRIVFMGTPEFAVPSLRVLAERYDVVGVVTNPDKPAGRGRRLVSPPVKEQAERLGIPCLQPKRLRDNPEVLEALRAWQPDVIVVAAYGKILPKQVLELPLQGCINVHPSLLPAWRGASPIQAAILAGDAMTGVTLIQMDEGMDSGPVLSQREEPILAEDTAESLGRRLANLGAALLAEALPGYLSGSLRPAPQDEGRVTYCKPIHKEDGLLDTRKSAEHVAREVRAFYPWPGVHFSFQGRLIKVLSAEADASCALDPGGLAVIGGFPAIGTVQGCLVLRQVQPAGKGAMPGDAFLRGLREWQGMRV
jgi:methionyl-tRNA formyltransferase